MSKQRVREQISISEDPLRVLRAARIAEYGDSEAIIEDHIQQMSDAEWGDRSRVRNGEMEIGELVGSPAYLRLERHEGRVGNRHVEFFPPCLVACLARLGKKFG